MDTDNKKIIVIDDDLDILDVYKSVLTPPVRGEDTSMDKLTQLLNVQTTGSDTDFQIEYASQGKEGYEHVAEAVEVSAPYALAFIDIRMPPGWDGLKTAIKIREIDQNIELVIVTAYSDHSGRTIADRIGNPEKLLYLKKPFDPEELTQIARSLTRKWNIAFAEKNQRRELETVLMTSPAAIFTINENGLITSWNKASEHITGYADSEVLGRPCIIPSLSVNARPCNDCLKGVDTIKEGVFDLLIQNKSGDKRIISKNCSIIRNEKGDFVKAVESFWDITDSKRVQNYIENVINSMPSTIISVDSEARIINLNAEAEKNIGYSLKEVKGKKIDENLPLLFPYVDDIKKAIETRTPIKKIKDTFQEDEETYYKDIVIYPLDVHGIKGAVIRIDDITSKVLLEEMVVQSEKMLMIGRFAAGMAHEINTPLAGIIQNLQVVKNRFSSTLPKNIKVADECGVSLDTVTSYLEKRDVIQMIDLALESGVRASEVVKNMLSFSRKSSSRYTLQNLNVLLDKTLTIANTEFKVAGRFDSDNIRIVREYQDDIPEVMCGYSKIQQVILNLLKNASQAMRADINQSSPQITLRTSSDGKMVRIEVEDNGPGMNETEKKQVFEPFFTTKDVGEGTGIGLFISYFIITETHKGTMTVESTPGEGTKFIMKIPIQRPG